MDGLLTGESLATRSGCGIPRQSEVLWLIAGAQNFTVFDRQLLVTVGWSIGRAAEGAAVSKRLGRMPDGGGHRCKVGAWARRATHRGYKYVPSRRRHEAGSPTPRSSLTSVGLECGANKWH
jgi:hypothetical protein